MDKNYLKTLLLSAGIAVFTGVILFGVNAAVGVEPTHDPPGAGISPVFTGLSVTGDTDLTGGSLYVAGDADFGGDIYGGLAVLGNIRSSILGNDLTIGDGSGGGLNILDDLTVASTSNLYEVIIDQWLQINGDLTVASDVEIEGSINNTLGDVFINDDLAVVGDVSINNDLDVTGDIVLDGDLVPGIGFDIDVAGELDVTGESQFFDGILTDSVSGIGGLDLIGVDDITAGINNSLSLNTSGIYAPNIILNPNNGEIRIGSSTNTENIELYGDTEIHGDIIADHFGEYLKRDSGFIFVAGGDNATASASCHPGEVIVSCGAQAAYTTSPFSATVWLTIRYVYSDLSTNTCYVRAQNEHASATRYLNAIATCFDPGGY